jgi:propionate CoA-transferase
MYHRKPSLALTLESKENKEEVIAQLRFINDVLRITPRRSAADWALARLAAGIFAAQSQRGDRVDIGVGLPEEVARLLYTSGITDQVTLLTESGVFGGIPAPGIFFGAAVNPTEIVSSAEAFKRIYQRLDSVILGVLQVDGEGNVNVSKRGEGAINYVGPGGFIDLTACAKRFSSAAPGERFRI